MKQFWENLSTEEIFILGFCFENPLMLQSLCRSELYGVICIQQGLNLWTAFDLLKSCRLTTPFILHYPAWLLTPRELASQMDAFIPLGLVWKH